MKGVVSVLVLTLSAVVPQPSEPLRAIAAIPMPKVEGRIDHIAADVEGARLFVAALGNNTLEVVDLKASQLVKSVPGFDEPQGIRYLPTSHRIVVANGGSGATMFLDGSSFASMKTVKLSGDADNVRYDAKTRQVFIGYGSGAMSILGEDGSAIADIRLAAHPESFQLEAAGPRMFVNVPSAGHVAVIDRDKHAVVATWPVTQARSNYPMALDETNHRLLIGCRTPARLLVFDTTSGHLVTSADIVGDTDDLFYDSARHRIYISGGEGFLNVLEQVDPDHYKMIQKLATAAGARTSLFVPELGRLFLAVPRRGGQGAEIRVFSVGD